MIETIFNGIYTVMSSWTFGLIISRKLDLTSMETMFLSASIAILIGHFLDIK